MTKQTTWNLCLCLVLLFVTLSKAAELTREKRQTYRLDPFIVGNELGARSTYSNGGSKLTGHLPIYLRGRLASRGIGASHDFGSSIISGKFGRNRQGNFGGISDSTSFGQNKVGGSWGHGSDGNHGFGVGYESTFDNNRGSWELPYGNSGGQSQFGISDSTSFGQNKVDVSLSRGSGGGNSFGIGYERSFDNNKGKLGLSYGTSGGQSKFGIRGSTSFGQNKVGGSWSHGSDGSNSFGVGYERSFDDNKGKLGLSYGNSGGQSQFGAKLQYRFKRSLPSCQYEVYCVISPCQYMDCPIGSVCHKDRCSCTAQCHRETTHSLLEDNSD